MGDRTDDPVRDVLGAFVARLLLDRLVGLAEAAYDDLPDAEREALRGAYTSALRDGVLEDAALLDGRALRPPSVPRQRRAEPQPLGPVEPPAVGGRTPSGGRLTPRELEVLGLVADGYSNGEIGRRLFISTKTVSVHVSHVLAKLGAASRTQAVALGRRQGVLAD